MNNIETQIKAKIKNIDLKLKTDNTLFSPKNIDIGTLYMLEEIDFSNESKVLDLGCGYGVIGILASKIIGENNVTMCDIDMNAVNISKKNAFLNEVPNIEIVQSDGLRNINHNDFSLILSNTPYHTDFSTAKHFIEAGFYKLILNGHFCMVTKRLDWYKNKLISVFGGVKVINKDDYYVFISQKRSNTPSSILKRRLKKQAKDELNNIIKCSKKSSKKFSQKFSNKKK